MPELALPVAPNDPIMALRLSGAAPPATGEPDAGFLDEDPDAVLQDDGAAFFYRRDSTGRLRWVSAGVEAVLGCAPAEAEGCPLLRWVAEEPANETLRLLMREHPAAPLPPPARALLRRADGGELWVEVVEEAVRGAEGTVMVLGFVRDVTRRRQAEARLLHGALHDPLTGLPNRALFLDRLRQVVQIAERDPDHLFAVLMVDLDGFKRVNDAFGHGAGDRLLVEVGRRLRQCVRPSDTVCRLGGDEFVLLFPGLAEAEDATRMAERILGRLGSTFRVDGHVIAVRASVGVAVGTRDRRDAAELVRDADAALYQAKAAGKGRHATFDPAARGASLARARLESELRGAVGGGELRVLYQPAFSLQTGLIAEFEALVRWNHPSRGLLPPAEFMAVADEVGLSPAVDDWVVREACRQIALWTRDFGERTPRISVNLAPRHLLRPGWGERLRAVREEAGIPAELLRVDLPGHALGEPDARAGNDLSWLPGALEIDDLATATRSMQHLRGSALGAVKLQPALVRADGGDELLRAVVGHAHAQRLEVIAVGVETPEQLRRMRTLCCDHAQGYLLSPPMNGDEAWLLLNQFAAL
ncbi:MAG TPA: diguanylate cyclase [Longimicrobium sp.]